MDNVYENGAASELRRVNDEFLAATGRRRRVFCRTFGCQMNARDSERILGLCLFMGFEAAERDSDADLVIFNTCCVRENAENKIFGHIGWLKNIREERRRQKRDFKAVVCGCMVQQGAVAEKIRTNYRHVDIVFGTYNIYRFPEMLLESYRTGKNIVDISEGNGGDEGVLPERREVAFKASVNIMYGCDNFCSYCIVPYVRGRERSRPASVVLEEVRRAAGSGAKEILLLGQNVNSYGKGLAEKLDFARLLRDVCAVGGVERVRFMTSHPKDLSAEIIAAMRDLPAVCKHLHLPFQAGGDAVLEKMNRRYTKKRYLELVAEIKREIPEIALTTDIIVGFPGETEEDFEGTLEVAQTARFNGAFTFLYSPRSGTPAAKMDGRVGAETAMERFNRLKEVTDGITFDINKSYEGKTLKVLGERRENGVVSGRADNNALVHFKAGERVVGEIVEVRITEGKPFYLMGEVL